MAREHGHRNKVLDRHEPQGRHWTKDLAPGVPGHTGAGPVPAPDQGEHAFQLGDGLFPDQLQLTAQISNSAASERGQGPVTVFTNQAAWASALSAAATRPGSSAKPCHMRGHLL